MDEQAASLISTEQQPAISKEDLKQRLRQQMDPGKLPQNNTIVVVSPHPDDDVICMSATLKALQERGNRIYVLYAVNGSNTVRPSEALYQKLYSELKNGNPSFSETELSELAKKGVREEEAKSATSILGIPLNHLIFFNAKYYMRRGIPGINPIGEEDRTAMKKVLEELKPDFIFFAAKNDPHGAHGLSTQLVALCVKQCDFIVSFYGYRGAYNEWSLVKDDPLLITTFNGNMMNTKIDAIKAHVSQLVPLFPSFDPRPFWQRAYDRNKESGQQLSRLADVNAEFAEVFKQFSKDEFCESYS